MASYEINLSAVLATNLRLRGVGEPMGLIFQLLHPGHGYTSGGWRALLEGGRHALSHGSGSSLMAIIWLSVTDKEYAILMLQQDKNDF